MNRTEPQRAPETFIEEAEHVFQLVERLRLTWLLGHVPRTAVWASYLFVNGFLTIGLLALLAAVTHNPFVFPSLGPTAYLFFFTPLAAASTPRNAILGHAIALVCGFAALSVAGAVHFPPAWRAEINGPHVLAAALSLSVTGAIMVFFHISHPPAGATTLIVSLGIISKPRYLVIVEIAVILLTAQAFAINRLAGLPYPLWQKMKVRFSAPLNAPQPARESPPPPESSPENEE